MNSPMPDYETQRAILDAEFYWLGGHVGSPKVFDSGTNYYAPPTVRGSHHRGDVDDGDVSTGTRTVTYESSEEGWSVSFDQT